MAWNQGELITASKLNSENNRPYKSVWFPAGADWIQDYLGNGGIWYSHVPAGSTVFKMRMDCGWFGGGKLIVERLDASGNVINTLYNTEHSWNTHIDINVKSVGPGRYRARSGTAFQIDGTTLYCYAYQTGCTSGRYLTLYDDFSKSGNRLTGTLITASLLNQGRGGVI